jgi:hypothetical protein
LSEQRHAPGFPLEPGFQSSHDFDYADFVALTFEDLSHTILSFLCGASEGWALGHGKLRFSGWFDLEKVPFKIVKDPAQT